MNKLFKSMVIATVVLPLSISTVYAKQGGKGGRSHGMPLQNMLQQVDLTEQQKVDLRSIMQSYRTANQGSKGAFHANRMAILQADEFDAQQAGSLIDAQDALRKSKKLKKMQMMYEVYHSLTSEQQGKMDLLFGLHQQRMLNQNGNQGKGNRGRMGMMNNQ